VVCRLTYLLVDCSTHAVGIDMPVGVAYDSTVLLQFCAVDEDDCLSAIRPKHTLNIVIIILYLT